MIFHFCFKNPFPPLCTLWHLVFLDQGSCPSPLPQCCLSYGRISFRRTACLRLSCTQQHLRSLLPLPYLPFLSFSVSQPGRYRQPRYDLLLLNISEARALCAVHSVISLHICIIPSKMHVRKSFKSSGPFFPFPLQI